MILISEYYGDGQHSSHTAKVMIDNDVPVVELSINGKVVSSTALHSKTVGEAEDLADDFVTGQRTLLS